MDEFYVFLKILMIPVLVIVLGYIIYFAGILVMFVYEYFRDKMLYK